MVAVSLLVGGVWWAQDDEPAEVAGARTDARGAGAPRASESSGAVSAPPASTPSAHRSPVSASPARTPSVPASPASPGGAPARPAPAGSASARPSSPGAPRPLPRSRAVRVDIPYLDIEAPVTGLRLDDRRRLPAPDESRPELVGWYEQGPAPGGPGTAVVVGHRDTRRGPAVFAALGALGPGHVVEVRRADGRTAVYTVDTVRTFEKDGFPNEEVYGRRDRPELRVITCGGDYDRESGYNSNIVVFAHLTAVREPGGEVGF
ncbi:hypothetical protein GCM10010365_27450 [Streptomyces poonensis]|uniref:Class F sortase n=1 Tax=Streptomyces poonensis TaxID=68255 RepID=A0A918UH28_9ACTN|nr:hypothetical protein GCM10010365_27450 [Streptomyces poonensis]GLJ88627.1 hypothetical protein GCM10017589_12270 [Streptomyces poonensis]